MQSEVNVIDFKSAFKAARRALLGGKTSCVKSAVAMREADKFANEARDLKEELIQISNDPFDNLMKKVRDAQSNST